MKKLQKQTCRQKGQFTVIGLIMVVLAMIVLGALMPTITQVIHDAKLCVTGTASILLDLVPVFLVIGVIISIVVYATVHREPEY